MMSTAQTPMMPAGHVLVGPRGTGAVVEPHSVMPDNAIAYDMQAHCWLTEIEEIARAGWSHVALIFVFPVEEVRS
jgi:hypothetical protein